MAEQDIYQYQTIPTDDLDPATTTDDQPVNLVLDSTPDGTMHLIPEDHTGGQMVTTTDNTSVPLHVMQPMPGSRYVNNRFAHYSHTLHQGAIIQIRTAQCNDSPEVIEAIRIPVSDPLDIQGYITEHEPSLKNIAIEALRKHMASCNHHIGAGEKLTNDDYSMALSVATVTTQAAQINGTSKLEGGMWMLQYPSYLYAQRTDILDPRTRRPVEESWQYIVNLYIHLNIKDRRGNYVARRIREKAEERARQEAANAAAAAAKAANAAQSSAVPDFNNSGKTPQQPPSNQPQANKDAGNQGQRRFGNQGQQGYRNPWNQEKLGERQQALEEKLDKVHQMLQVSLKQAQLAPTQFPPTPTPDKPVWRHSGESAIPPARL